MASSQQTPSTSIDDTIDRMISTPSVKFIPSSTWQGPKPGYYFGTTSQDGTGYHLDTKAPSSTTLKRPPPSSETPKSENGDQSPPRKKTVRFSKKTPQELLLDAERTLQSQPHRRILTLTPEGICSHALLLQKSISRNRIARTEHSSTPRKFLESELTLHENVLALKSAAVRLDLYETMIDDCDIVATMLGLMSHENSDVALAVLEVLGELLDVGLVETEVDGHRVALLGWSLAREGGVESICHHLDVLKEDDEEDAKGMENILTIIENLLDLNAMNLFAPENFDEQTAPPVNLLSLLSSTNLLPWLLTQISADKKSSPLKLHSCEILSTILQQSSSSSSSTTPSPITLSPHDGIEALLQLIALHRKKHPTTLEDTEILENALAATAAATLSSSDSRSFLDAQGLELMMRCVRERVHSGKGALRVLHFVLSSGGGDGASLGREACETFVDVGGLKVLFPVFMGRSGALPKPAPGCSDAGGGGGGGNGKTTTTKKVMKAKREWVREIEGDVVRILYALTRFLDDGSKYDAKERLLAKFVENDCEKCDRLVELLLKYDDKARLAEARYLRSDEADEAETAGVDVDMAALNAKLKGGGDEFHRLGAICAFVAVGSKRCHKHIMEQLHLKSSGVGVIKAALEEFSNVLDDGEQKSQLDVYISSM